LLGHYFCSVAIHHYFTRCPSIRSRQLLHCALCRTGRYQYLVTCRDKRVRPNLTVTLNMSGDVMSLPHHALRVTDALALAEGLKVCTCPSVYSCLRLCQCLCCLRLYLHFFWLRFSATIHCQYPSTCDVMSVIVQLCTTADKGKSVEETMLQMHTCQCLESRVQIQHAYLQAKP
jgi:hypothetical protein